MKNVNIPINRATVPIPRDPRRALPFLRHLVTFGEASQAEARGLGGVDWVPLLVAGGLLAESDGGACTVTPSWLTWLCQIPETELLRAACFAYPVYRRYLVGILAQGFLDAGRVDLYPRLENWIVGQVPHLAGEINAVLEAVQTRLDGQRPLTAKPGALVTAFQSLPERATDFAHWNQALLGISGSPEAISMAVLDKFGSLSARLSGLAEPKPKAQGLAATRESSELYGFEQALLPAIPLRDQDEKLLECLSPAAWNVQRPRVHSSLPLFSVSGAPLFDPTCPVAEVLQDALFEQPFYRAVIHLAVDITMARRSGEERLALLTGAGNDLGVTVVLAQDHQVGALSALLPSLVRVLGFQPIPDQGPLETKRVTRLLDNLLIVDVLRLTNGELRLADAYTTSLLNPPRLQTVVRAHRAERRRLVEYLVMGE
jgi:hypothetical protein